MLTETYTGCDLDTNSLYLEGNNVLYNSSIQIGGFQLKVNGGASGASGGDASSNGFSTSNNGSTIMGFSLTGNTIPPGCGTLIQLTGASAATGISNITISDDSGASIPFSYWTPPSSSSTCPGWPTGGQHPDHNSWLTYFTSLPNFSSANPKQPCRMLCKKLATWNNKLTNVNPGKADIISRLTCKISSGNDLIQTHNCSC